MLTLKIDNKEIENFIINRYGVDTKSLFSDFAKFVKESLEDDYLTISSQEAKERVDKAIKEIENNRAIMIPQDAYNKDMDDFIKSL